MSSNHLEIQRFVVGMSRAGTTWMGKCLNEHPDAAVFGESLFWGRAYVEPEQDGAYSGEQVARIIEELKCTAIAAFEGAGPGCLRRTTKEKLAEVLDQEFSHESGPITPGDLFLRIGRLIAECEGKRIAIEKTPHHVNWIKRILTELPESRFVVMVRDPYGFMLSYKHQGDRKEPELQRKLRRLYHPILCAVIWRGYMRAARMAIKTYRKQVMVVEFDRLQQNSNSILRLVQEFFLMEYVDLAQRIPPDNSSFPVGDRPSLGAEDIFWMNVINRTLIQEAGFCLRDLPPHGALRIIMSTIVLPLWGFRTLISARSLISGSVPKYIWQWLKVGER